MGGVTVDDPYYVLLALAVLSVLVAIAAAVWRSHSFTVRLVLSVEFGAIGVLLWNTTAPDSLDVTNPAYYTIAVVVAAAAVFTVWSAAKGWVGGGVVLVGLLVLLVVGRDKISDALGSTLSDTAWAVVFTAIVLVMLLAGWWLSQLDRLWRLVEALFMGFALALAVDVIVQEAESGHDALQLLDFTDSDTFIAELVAAEVVYPLVFYRHVVAPCWFAPPPLQSPPQKTLLRPPSPVNLPPPPVTTTKLSSRHYYSLSSLSDSDSEPSSS